MLEAQVWRNCDFRVSEPGIRWTAFEVVRETPLLEIEIGDAGFCIARPVNASAIYGPSGDRIDVGKHQGTNPSGEPGGSG